MDLAKVSYFRSGDRRPLDIKGPGGGNCQHQRELLLTGLFPRNRARCGNGMHQDFPPKLHPGATGCEPLTGDVKCVAETVMASFDPATATSPEARRATWVESLRRYES